MKSDVYMPFWGWLILCGLMGYGGFLLWHYELWQQMMVQDLTYLSSAIIILFLLTTLYLGRSAWRIAREHQHSQALSDSLRTGSRQPLSTQDTPSESEHPTSWVHNHLSLLVQLQAQNPAQPQSDTLQARLVEQVHGGHQTGWFMADLLLRLGLLGTVIGFVLMLGAVYGLEEDGISALKTLLTSMGGGMQVALYTTLSGLGAATLLSIQCHWLDRCADRLVSHIIEIGITDLAAFSNRLKNPDSVNHNNTQS